MARPTTGIVRRRYLRRHFFTTYTMHNVTYLQLRVITLISALHFAVTVLHGARTGLILFRLRHRSPRQGGTPFSEYPNVFFWLQVAHTALGCFPGVILLIILWCDDSGRFGGQDLLARSVLVAIIICSIFTDVGPPR